MEPGFGMVVISSQEITVFPHSSKDEPETAPFLIHVKKQFYGTRRGEQSLFWAAA